MLNLYSRKIELCKHENSRCTFPSFYYRGALAIYISVTPPLSTLDIIPMTAIYIYTQPVNKSFRLSFSQAVNRFFFHSSSGEYKLSFTRMLQWCILPPRVVLYNTRAMCTVYLPILWIEFERHTSCDVVVVCLFFSTARRTKMSQYRYCT